MTKRDLTDSILLKISEIERARGRLEALRPPQAILRALRQPAPILDLPVAEEWFRGAHRRLISVGGTYRTDQAYLSDPDTGVIEYIPPTPQEIERLMREFLNWLNKPTTLHPLLFAASAHFRLVQIHPFLNGNGRIARLLTQALLHRAGYDFKGIVPLTEFDRPTYYRAIQAVREANLDLTPWYETFLEHVAKQVVDLQSRLITAMTPSLKAREQQILGYALGADQFTLSDLEAEYPTCHRRTLQRAVRTLLDHNLLTEDGATNCRAYRLQSYESS